MIDVGGIRRGPTSFRFEVLWLKVEGFKDLLKTWWKSLSPRGTSSYTLASKLKALKTFLKSWNKDAFSGVEVNKSKALRMVNFWDDLEMDKLLSLKEFEDMNLVREDFKYWSLLEEIS